MTNPDYTNMEKEDAVKDFMKRIEHYRLFYEPLDEEKESKYSFMKIFDAGKACLVGRARLSLRQLQTHDTQLLMVL